jgi:ribosomal protein S18 acetylase RimI-like enzyme
MYIRDAVYPVDSPFIQRMLLVVAQGAHPNLPTNVEADPNFIAFKEALLRDEGLTLIAEECIADQCSSLGMAACRLFTFGDHSYGFVSEEVPELVIARTPEARGRSVGAFLMGALIERASLLRVPGLSLNVEANNVVAIAAYRRQGFREYRREPDGSMTMLLQPATHGDIT